MVKRAKRRGRPPLPADRKKDRSITFKVNQELAERLNSAAKSNGQSLSNEIVDRLDAGESEANWGFALDLMTALRSSDGWAGGKRTEQFPYEGTEPEKTRALLRLVVDAHTGNLPPDWLESKRYGPTEARVAAYALLRLHKLAEKKS